MIDRLREQIQHRLDQILSEAERLRSALVALGPRSSSASPRKAPRQNGRRREPAGSGARPAKGSRTRTATTRPVSPVTPEPTAAARSPRGRRTAGSPAGSSRRAAPGASRAAVLAALSGGQPMTAGEVAQASGLARSTVSSTLSKLARSGEVQKAERGYRLAPADRPAEPPSGGVTGTPAGGPAEAPSGGVTGTPSGWPAEPPSGGVTGTPAGGPGEPPPGEITGTPAGESGEPPPGEVTGTPVGESGEAPSPAPDSSRQ